MSKFDDDMARGCLPTGEPLECLYGVGWWTEHDEPEPDPYDLHIAELESRITELEAAQRWIPVSERLPEFNKVVAVIDMSDKDSHLCNVYETAILVEVRGDTRFGFIGHSGWDSSDVTHWMPLPKLPEVQE